VPLTLEELRGDVERGDIDTVLLVMTDMQGRLQGKRLHAPFFCDEVAAHGAEGCYYLLTVDVDMQPVQGFEMASWESGYGDFVFRPDMATLRRIPWLERTALVVCDIEWQDGRPVAPSPRQILRRQLDRLAERGLVANIGSELEFFLFRETYDTAREKRYHDLTPANPYNVDYSILGTTMVEDVIRPIRIGMAAAGIRVEDSKGECNFGQHEVNFRYSDALTMADNHAVYKNGAKEIAHAHGYALSFMAKYDEREGNSCHIHCSLWDENGTAFADGDGHQTELFRRFLAGQLAATRELTLCFAPNVNSYKRYAWGSFAPTTLAWGVDNRTCAFRVVGHGPGLRVESRLAGADTNPGSRTTSTSRMPTRATPTTRPTSRGCRQASRRRSTSSRARRWRARRSARRWSTTTCTTRARSSGRSRPPSRTGRSSAPSSAFSGAASTARAGPERGQSLNLPRSSPVTVV
jgi:glutamine synthetase